MKNADLLVKLGELGLKYANEGLFFDIVFNRWGMVFEGRIREYRYNQIFSYSEIKSFPDDVEIETLAEMFKDKMFKELEKIESEDT